MNLHGRVDGKTRPAQPLPLNPYPGHPLVPVVGITHLEAAHLAAPGCFEGFVLASGPGVSLRLAIIDSLSVGGGEQALGVSAPWACAFMD